MINAHSFTAPTASFAAQVASLRFGIDAKSAAAALRQLADMLDSGAVLIDSVRVQTLATKDDFTTTILRLKLHERAPLQPSTKEEVKEFISMAQSGMVPGSAA